MNYEKIFPTLIGTTQTNFESNLLNQWRKFIDVSEKEKLVTQFTPAGDSDDYLTKSQRLLDNSLIFSPLKEEILSSAREYATEMTIEFEDLQICNSWSYIIGRNNDPNNFHKHSNSMISGVYYLSLGSPIEFENDINSSLPFTWPITNQENYDKVHHQIAPEEQLLILFPSNLSHRVTPNFIDERYCIAFNIIPKGYFGHSFGNFTL